MGLFKRKKATNNSPIPNIANLTLKGIPDYSTGKDTTLQRLYDMALEQTREASNPVTAGLAITQVALLEMFDETYSNIKEFKV